LGNYQWGKYRGNISSSALYKTIDTDGLEFAARKTTCSWSEENITAFTSSAGGLTSGANTCIKKGFRHYPVTVAEGVVVDVIITHMNTYSSSGSSHINAQHAQLKQIAQYINNLVAKNNRPVILMGDTNCRYTRHDFQTYFWSVLNSNLTYADPWVEFQWNGVYPTYPSKSLMVSDATGTNADTDIICENTQKGEVVDKVIYINSSNAPVQIKANSYLRDMNFSGLADHMPIVVEFAWEKKN
jgi:exonuclease III